MAKAVKWSENLQFPFCEFCLRGQTCICLAEQSQKEDPCDFCSNGCDCDYKQVEEGLFCECDCSCEADRSTGECEDCCDCHYPLRSDLPDQCECECTCPKCVCRCECQILVIDAKSYNKWVKEMCYVCPPQCLGGANLKLDYRELQCKKEVGPYVFYIRTIPPTHIERRPKFGTLPLGLPMFLLEPSEIEETEVISKISIIQNDLKGSVSFNGPVQIPILAKERGGYDKNQIWMSLTPMEVMSQKPGLDLAQGRVLIGGLGMGWLTQRVLEKPGVTHVTQIEIDPDIIQFFGQPLLQKYGDKLEILEANVWEFLESLETQEYDTILLDIWPRYHDSRSDPNVKELRKVHPRIWAWGEIFQPSPKKLDKSQKKGTAKKKQSLKGFLGLAKCPHCQLPRDLCTCRSNPAFA